jgi:NAD(P)-dependent dehydrogenase (short-subunit alcohol dehydrogenase family)
MDLQLAGKGAIVTGGSRGIGLAIVRALVDEGARVVTGSRTVPEELRATGAVPVVVDLSTVDGPGRLVEQAVEVLGDVDLLINNAGIGDLEQLTQGALLDLIELPEDAWRHTFDLHFYAVLRTIRAALPSLLRTRGTVVNVSSAGARLVTAGPVHYNVAKAALNALTRVVAEQYGPRGVRAVTVSPGPVSTGVWTDPEGFIGRIAAHQGVPHEAFAKQLMAGMGASTGRMSTPEEVARLVVFAAAPNNINGADLLVDGGVVKG